MIIGCFINSFKSYTSTEYINLTNSSENQFTSIIGTNGSGKSTILEAINYVFKQGEWITNKSNGNSPDSYVTCLFKIEKNTFNRYLSNNSTKIDKQSLKEYIEAQNSFLTNSLSQSLAGAVKTEHIDNLIRQLASIKNKEDYFIVAIGRDIDGKTITKPFSRIYDDKMTPKLYEFLTSYYNYIYIPATSIASDVLKIHGMHMQNIMNKDVVNQISHLLNKKVKLEDKEKSILDHVNNELNKFVDEINFQLKKIDNTYEFKTQPSIKRNVTSQDVTQNIIQAFFEKRILRVSSKDVKNLSSGEQRKAIIDVIYSFLKNKNNENDNITKQIIFAIDEPELSQDIGNCHDQFERLYEIATQLNNQVILTTHWYGLLPIIDRGTLIHIKNNEKKNFSFYNFLDQRENFPDDLNMKSLYDLSNSIRNYLRTEKSKNIIVCEGGTDKTYLETFLDKEKVKIIPCGGKDNVIILYKLLLIAIINDSKLSSSISKKILFLVDTDHNITRYDEIEKSKNEKIDIKRLQINGKNKTPCLISLTDTKTENHHSTTRIEDVLDSKTYYETLKDVLLKYDPLFNDFEFVPGKDHSRIESNDSIIYPRNIDAVHNLEKLYSQISKRKTEISITYSRKFNEKLDNKYSFKKFNTPEIFEKYFKDDVIKKTITNNKKENIKALENVAKSINNISKIKLSKLAYLISRIK